MKVIDLIIALQQCDPNKDVMLDITKDNSNVFKCIGIEACDEIETSLGEKFVMLSPFDYAGIEENQN